MTEKWDKLVRLNQVGPRGSKVKPLVNLWSMVGGELKEPKRGVVGPLRWAQNTTQVVGVGD